MLNSFFSILSLAQKLLGKGLSHEPLPCHSTNGYDCFSTVAISMSNIWEANIVVEANNLWAIVCLPM